MKNFASVAIHLDIIPFAPMSATVPCSTIDHMIDIRPEDLAASFPLLSADDCNYMAECVAYAANEGHEFVGSFDSWEMRDWFIGGMSFVYFEGV